MLVHQRYVSSNTRSEPSLEFVTFIQTGPFVTIQVLGAAAAANASEQYMAHPVAVVVPSKLKDRVAEVFLVTVYTLTLAAWRVVSV